MNIFVLDRDVYKSVSYHTDTHVRKILIESVQMLSIAAAYNIGFISDTVDTKNKRRYAVFKLVPGLYKYTKSQASHPCSIWARSCIQNAWWLLKYARALAKEYKYRFDKEPSSNIIETLRKCEQLLERPKMLPSVAKASSFHQCMPDNFSKKNAVSAYRDYYFHKKQGVYTNRSVPFFMKKPKPKKCSTFQVSKIKESKP